MKSFPLLLVLVLIFGGGLHVEAVPSAATAKTQAAAALKLLENENYDAYTDTLYPTMLDSLGGRQEAPGWIKQKWNRLKIDGWKITRTLGEVAAPVTAGGKVFAVVPMVVTMESSTQRSVTHSYFVAISTDGGTTWKFVDAATEDPATIRSDFVPDLPASVQLPEHEDPQLTNR